MDTEVPITSHPSLPDDVPLVASFHDDRNRLSYYHPRLESCGGVQTPVTAFFGVDHTGGGIPSIDGRRITQFMQDIGVDEAFVRSDYSSAKIDPEAGSHLTSQDPHDIEHTIAEMFAQHAMMERWGGGRVAVREWIAHDIEVRYIARFGDVVYHDAVDVDTDDIETPDWQAETVASEFDTFAWSIDFIRHEDTGSWYCTDMGLDGLYWNEPGKEWIAISEHLDAMQSPERSRGAMPDPSRFQYRR